MPDVLTAAKQLVKQTIGGNVNSWGGILNDNMELIDKSLGQTLLRDITSNTTITSAEAQYSFYTLTGTGPAAVDVVWPSYRGFLVVFNSLSSDTVVTCKMLSGAGATVWPGEAMVIYSDGLDFRLASGAAVLR
jgi:hypothetical protein